MKRVWAKIKEWSWRYIPAEIVGVIIGTGAALFAFEMHPESLYLMGLAGTWGENVGYYGYIFAQDVRADKKEYRSASQKFLKHLRSMFFEFGLAEVLDSFFLRPFLIATVPGILGNLSLGIIAGMLIANVIFYALAIVFYELKKKAA